MKYPGYQCIKTKARDIYCSAKTYKSHPAAEPWVAACVAHYKLKGNDILGKPYVSNDQPKNAIIFAMPKKTE